MAEQRRRRAGFARAVVALLCVAVSIPWGGARSAVAAPHPAQAVAEPAPLIDGISTTTSSTYVIDPGGGAVHATVAATITNQTPPSGYSFSYLPTFSIALVKEAANVSAHRADGSEMTVNVHATKSPYVAGASVTLSPPLYFNDTQQLSFTYDIPAQPARSPGATRVNAAYVSFPVFPGGDPGKTDVEVDVPSALKFESSGSKLEVEHRDGVDAYTAKAIADPESWFAFVAAHDDSALLRTDVPVGDAALATLAWPGDQEWADFVADHIRRGIPALEAGIGLPWPGEPIDVIESVAPYLYGYAGWYTRQDHTVEMGDELDPAVVIHELSHIWFNDSLVNSRWVNEGLAQELASEVVAGLGETAPPAGPIDPGAEGAIVLNDWADPDLTSPISDAQEAFGYNASYAIIHQIATEIGPDRMREVFAAAAARQIPYRGNPETETMVSSADWRRFLDLLVEVGGSTSAEALVHDHVANAVDQMEMDNRAAARAAYAGLRTAGGTWSPPYAVRSDLATWAFGAANTDIAAATAVLGVRDQIAATLAPVHLDVPAALQASYESATNITDLAATAQKTLDAATAIVAAQAAVDRSANPLGRVGLLGGSATRPLDDAKHALAKGDPDAALAAAHRAERAVHDATRSGALRLAALALVAAVAYGAVRVRRTHRRRRAAQPPTEAEPTQAPYSLV